jgi:hypothetical protein
MSLFSTITHLADEYAKARSRYLTERTLRSLPFEVQKDIGWPEVDDTRRPASRETAH